MPQYRHLMLSFLHSQSRGGGNDAVGFAAAGGEGDAMTAISYGAGFALQRMNVGLGELAVLPKDADLKASARTQTTDVAGRPCVGEGR